ERWKLSLRSAYDKRDFAAQNFYTSFASDTASEEVSSLWNQLQIQYKGVHDLWTIDLGYKNVNDHYRYNAATIANENKSQLWQSLLKNERKIDDQTALTLGIQFINKKII